MSSFFFLFRLRILTQAFCKPEVTKLRPAGEIRPEDLFYPARHLLRK